VIRINLLPAQAIAQVSSKRKEIGLAGGIFVTALLAVVAAHVLQSLQLSEVNRTLDKLEGQLTTIRKQNQDLEKMERQKKELEDKLRVINLLTSPQRRAASVHVLDDLSSSTPEFLWLTEYTENRGVAQIRGKAIDNQTIASFARNLSNSHYFRNVEIRETQQEAQTITPRTQTGKNEVKEATASSIMMTKFLIEAAINYGSQMETANVRGDKSTSSGKKEEEKKIPVKAATAAAASKAGKD
jgi:Tfp pilus assembly protein PilN